MNLKKIIKFVLLYICLPVLLLAILLVIAASVHFLPKVPQIKGSVVRGGKPVSGITVQYVSVACKNNRSNKSIEAEAKTDNEGKFVLAGSKGLRFIVPLPADYIVCWRLCFQESGKEPKCWEVEAFGPPSPPEFFELECDLDLQNICKVKKCSYKYFNNRLQEE